MGGYNGMQGQIPFPHPHGHPPFGWQHADNNNNNGNKGDIKSNQLAHGGQQDGFNSPGRTGITHEAGSKITAPVKEEAGAAHLKDILSNVANTPTTQLAMEDEKAPTPKINNVG